MGKGKYYIINPIDTSNNIYYTGKLQSTDDAIIYKFSNITEFVTNQNTRPRGRFPPVDDTMEFSKHNYTFEMMGRSDGKSRRKSIKRKRRLSKSGRKSIKRRSKSRRRYSK